MYEQRNFSESRIITYVASEHVFVQWLVRATSFAMLITCAARTQLPLGLRNIVVTMRGRKIAHRSHRKQLTTVGKSERQLFFRAVKARHIRRSMA